MKRKIRAWLYFLLFIAAYAALSTMRELDVYFTYVWLAGMLALSIITLSRWWNHAQHEEAGFGISRLPLPRSWKRWIYDEQDDPQK